jgi:hypothetical protein
MRHCDHILGDLLAPAHARIVTLRRNVGQSMIDDDLHLDVGIFRQEFRQPRPDSRLDCVVPGGDPNGAGRLPPKRTQRLELGVDLLKPGLHGVHQTFAGFGQRDAARRAREKP